MFRQHVSYIRSTTSTSLTLSHFLHVTMRDWNSIVRVKAREAAEFPSAYVCCYMYVVYASVSHGERKITILQLWGTRRHAGKTLIM